MTDEQLEHALKKALEVWSLQNMADLAILLGFVALALVAGRAYLEALKSRLTLRVAVEVWETLTDATADALLLFIGLVGLLVTNMDIMADIKLALPFVPLGYLLMAAALVLRTFHGGRKVASRAWWTTVVLMGIACVVMWFGFTFIMEGAGEEYLALHPGATIWITLGNLRSNVNPNLAMSTFLWAGPGFILVFAWGVVAGLANTLRWAGRKALPAKGGPADER